MLGIIIFIIFVGTLVWDFISLVISEDEITGIVLAKAFYRGMLIFAFLYLMDIMKTW